MASSVALSLASAKLPAFYHHLVRRHDADFELDFQGNRTHDNPALRSVPDAYILDSLFRHHQPTIEEFHVGLSQGVAKMRVKSPTSCFLALVVKSTCAPVCLLRRSSWCYCSLHRYCRPSCSVLAPSAPSGETIRDDALFSSAYHARDYLCLWRPHSIETQSPAIQSGPR